MIFKEGLQTLTKKCKEFASHITDAGREIGKVKFELEDRHGH